MGNSQSTPAQMPPPLKILKARPTPHNFTAPPRGWNSFGLQINPAINPAFTFDQSHVIQQAERLVEIVPPVLLEKHDYYISLDSGWSIGDHGDEHGRTIYDSEKFDIPSLAALLHSRGLKLGVYVLPGAFEKDGEKNILGTDIRVSQTWSGNNNGFARCDFDFKKPGVQEWHNSVVALFADWGVDLIKLDYITPGSPSNGGNLPPDNSGSVIAYHRAIQKTGRQIRLDVSWKLERKNRKFFDIWSANADSMRTDQDINNSKSNTFVKWATVQRAIDNYCDFSSLAVSVSKNPTLSIFPDMDNMFVGNDKSITGVGDAQRETIATHWICAAANLITGSDLTRLDELGIKLLTDEKAQAAADFTSKFPMQPRNPGTGRNDSRQLQAWIAGPSEGGTGRAIVILVNYGPDEGQGGFGTQLKGPQVVSVSWADLGLHGAYKVYNIWARTDDGVADGYITATLDEGESVMLDLVPVA